MGGQSDGSALVDDGKDTVPISNPPPPDGIDPDKLIRDDVPGMEPGPNGGSIVKSAFNVPPVPIDGMRFGLLGFDVAHPHVQHLLSIAESRGALFVAHPTPDSVDLNVVLDRLMNGGGGGRR